VPARGPWAVEGLLDAWAGRTIDLSLPHRTHRTHHRYSAKVLRQLFELLAVRGSGTAFLSDRVADAALQ
jgi:hypothetical protein